jgi:HK97 family phage prohead protease
VKTLRDLAVVRSAVAPVTLRPDTRKTISDELADTAAEAAQRADAGDSQGDIMTVGFSAFDTWYPIDSFWEGRFLERTAPGSFAKTIAERADQIKVLFNHGMEMLTGDMILGAISLLEERANGPYAEVPLLDGVPPLIVSGLRAGVYGSSFMFEVLRDDWNLEPQRSDYNPDGIPERTIREVRLLEFGPVTWPANPAATAGLRSDTDRYAERLRDRAPERFEALAARFTDFRAQHGLRTPETGAARQGTPDEGAANMTDAPDTAPADVHPDGLSPDHRAAQLRGLKLMELTR